MSSKLEAAESCLFECLFSALLNACMLSSDVIMIKNEFGLLCYLITAFEGLEASFFLDWVIRAAGGST